MVTLYINDVNVSSQYGIYLTENSLATLMSPVPVKDYIENKPTMGHGKQILTTHTTYRDERDITLTIGIKASSQLNMLQSFEYLKTQLYKGDVTLRTDFEGESVKYRLYYRSCSQMTTFFRGLAKFQIKFNEPNPNNRGA